MNMLNHLIYFNTHTQHAFHLNHKAFTCMNNKVKYVFNLSKLWKWFKYHEGSLNTFP